MLLHDLADCIVFSFRNKIYAQTQVIWFLCKDFYKIFNIKSEQKMFKESFK